MDANPFIFATKIRNPLYFYGREQEARRVLTSVGNSQCCVVVGGSKVGKSSLLHYISLPEMRQAYGLDTDKHVFVEFDFQVNPLISWADFWRQILGDVAIELKDAELKQAVQNVRQDLAQISDVGIALQQMGSQQIDQRVLQGHLATYFNLEELKQLAFDLKIDYENLPDNRQAFARELVLLCHRQSRLDELVAAYNLKRQRSALQPVSRDPREQSLLRNRIQNKLSDLFQKFREKSITLVFLFDEFESIRGIRELFDIAFLDYLRALHNQYGVVYVLASDTELQDLVPRIETQSDFGNIFTTIFLGMFRRRDLLKLIDQEKAPGPVSLRDEERFVSRLAGGHPYLTQSVCRRLYDFKTEKESLTEADHVQVAKDSLDDLSPFFDISLWPSLSEDEHRVLTYIAKDFELDTNEHRATIRRLRRSKQYIKEKGDGWVTFCDLLKDYILTVEPEI